MKETGIVIKVFLNKDTMLRFIEDHNTECFSYEQVYTYVESDMEVE